MSASLAHGVGFGKQELLGDEDQLADGLVEAIWERLDEALLPVEAQLTRLWRCLVVGVRPATVCVPLCPCLLPAPLPASASSHVSSWVEEAAPPWLLWECFSVLLWPVISVVHHHRFRDAVDLAAA